MPVDGRIRKGPCLVCAQACIGACLSLSSRLLGHVTVIKHRLRRTFAVAGQNGARVAHVGDGELVAHQHGGNRGAAVVLGRTPVRQVLLVCRYERLGCRGVRTGLRDAPAAGL